MNEPGQAVLDESCGSMSCWDDPEPWMTAWEYADRTGMLTYDKSDAEFVRDLDADAWYVAGKRGLAARAAWTDGHQVSTWPETVLRDVADAMAQRAANRGHTHLHEGDLDAVAEGFFPDPEYRSRPRTRVVHCRRERCDVLIDRATVWGNPYLIGRDGDRAQVIARYAAYLRTRPDLLARIGELRGKVLGCWCRPEPCHGDVLAALADDPGSYAPVTGPRLPEPGWRFTAYYWAAHRGLPTTLEYLTELGAIAAGEARWAGLRQATVPEGPYIVHTWPEQIWRAAEAKLAAANPYA